ncbi:MULTISPECIES: acyl-CoA dehydrogenase family protein [Micrococcaceae]|uniref:Acyl-CoA dehydrogenase probable dibenzothiophene desulfurization enzyme n=1 Tax=Arthrobacter rhombi TaxID=71253 RepID=A0A1R4GHA6_9MICC|nr:MULTISPECIES: acyl-CoA dehydrogenase family protein [Micrococcaceae]PCC25153.1 acyl-CoA dehydrogenase [Glutamicibacter sp. BW78]SJM67559.1 Acyl-CoA dehydrogenase; probable dibenzothiophene desulfurization enzyme [Arthrobacter rhombi]
MAALTIDDVTPRHLIKLTPGVPADGHYDELAAVFRPVFASIADGAAERDARRILPFEQVGWLNRARFGALRVPREAGGFGASLVDSFRLLIELGEADSQIAQLLRAHIGFVESVLLLHDEEVKTRWFARFVAGQIVGNAYTERGGNDLGQLNTAVEHSEAGWLLTGEKYYCTGTIFADWVAVTAMAPAIEGRHIAVVSTQHSGVVIHDDWDGFGQQLTGTGSTGFARVPVDTLLDPEVLDIHPESAIFQLVLLAVQAGIARAVLADVRAHTQLRERAFTTGTGLPSRHEPQILQVVGEISSTAFAIDAILLAAVAELESVIGQPGLSAAEQYAVCELAANRAQSAIQPLVLEVTSQLFDGLGASATSAACNLDRHWRNARTVATHNPAMYKSRIVGDYEVNAAAPRKLGAVGDLKTPEGEK